MSALSSQSPEPDPTGSHKLSVRERARLAGILARLASPFEHERAAAGLLATAFLRKHQLGWADIVGMAPSQAVAQDPPSRDRRRTDGRLWRGYCRRQRATPGQSLNFTG